jgi:hypothetical protein
MGPKRAFPVGRPRGVGGLCWLGLLLAGVAGLPGCGGVEYAEVEGTVTLDGKPLPEVEVLFLPDPERGGRGPRSTAFTDEFGRYRLRTDKGQAGAVVGSCRVCINDIRALETPGAQGGASGAAGPSGAAANGPARRPLPPSRVPEPYTSAARTPFRDVAVKPSKQTLDFDVKSGKR